MSVTCQCEDMSVHRVSTLSVHNNFLNEGTVFCALAAVLCICKYVLF